MIRKRAPPPNCPLILIPGLANLILRSLNSVEFSKKLRSSPKFTTAIACRKVRLAIARDITQLGLTAKTAIISIWPKKCWDKPTSVICKAISVKRVLRLNNFNNQVNRLINRSAMSTGARNVMNITLNASKSVTWMDSEPSEASTEDTSSLPAPELATYIKSATTVSWIPAL